MEWTVPQGDWDEWEWVELCTACAADAKVALTSAFGCKALAVNRREGNIALARSRVDDAVWLLGRAYPGVATWNYNAGTASFSPVALKWQCQ